MHIEHCVLMNVICVIILHAHMTKFNMHAQKQAHSCSVQTFTRVKNKPNRQKHTYIYVCIDLHINNTINIYYNVHVRTGYHVDGL